MFQGVHRLILERLLAAVPTLAAVLVVTFFLMRVLPGDPAAFFAGPAATSEAVEEVRRNLGLDRSLPRQFGDYLAALGRADMGTSLATGRPVTSELAARLPASLELTAAGLALAALVGIPLGTLAAVRRGGASDYFARGIATAGVCLPSFFVGTALIYVFYYRLGWSPPPFGRLGPFTEPPAARTGFLLLDSLAGGDLHVFREALALLALPAITLGLFACGPLIRLTRAALLDVLSSRYLLTARSLGVSERRIVLIHAARNALLPVLASTGAVFPYLLGINALVEKVFAWPGAGSFALEALLAADYAAVQGYVLTLGVLYTAVNLAVDLAGHLIDPRLRRHA
jgi:peptide/nickel transport system permease protein